MADQIPVAGVLAREGEMTGDGRTFAANAIRWGSDVLPLPIIFDREEGDHSGATIGYIETVWRDGADIRGQGYLSASDDPTTVSLVNRAAELLDEGAVGVSVGVDSPRGHADIDLSAWADVEEDDDHLRIPINYDDVALTFTEARLRHLAIVDTPAFSTATISRMERTGVLVASASMSKDWMFNNPDFGVPGVDDRLKYDPGNGKWSCPPTIRGDHYFGHVAPWGVCLRGQPGRCVTPPDANLESFMRHYADAAGGRRTGVVQVAGSHADIGIGVMAAQAHYDKTGVAAADVRVGRDAYGVWFSGMIRPGITNEQRYALGASDVSGHWEMDTQGRLELVGLPAVNVGGFPKGYLSADELAQGIAAAAAVRDGVITHFLDTLEKTPGESCGCGDGSAHGEVKEITLAELAPFL